MAKALKYHFYLKDSSSLNPTPIYFILNKGTLRLKKGVDEQILPKYWDKASERAIETSIQSKNEKALSKRVNKKLDRISSDLEDLFEDYSGMMELLTPNHTEGVDLLEELSSKVISIIDGEARKEQEAARLSRITPSEFFEDFIDKWSKTINPRSNRVPSKGTITNYKINLGRYRSFISDNKIKDTFKVFDGDFQYKYDVYLGEELELSPNTISSAHSQLKVMLKRAYENGLLKDSSFLHWSTTTTRIKHPYLTFEELKLIMNLSISEKQRKDNKIGELSHILESRDLFIISAFTALRYSDIKKLNLASWDINGSGNSFLRIISQKTLTPISIPLRDEVISIYNKYKGILPTVVDKSHYNEHIRLCAKLAGIDDWCPCLVWENGRQVVSQKHKWELISSHTGRRSYCTNMYLVTKDCKLVMSVSGHQSEENFLAYLQLSQEEQAKRMQKYINSDYAELIKKDTTSNSDILKSISEVRKEIKTLTKMKEGEIPYRNPYGDKERGYQEFVNAETETFHPHKYILTQYQMAVLEQRIQSLKDNWGHLGLEITDTTIKHLADKVIEDTPMDRKSDS